MFTIRPLTIILPSREDKDHPVIDLDLHLPFLCFRPQQLLQVPHIRFVFVLIERVETHIHFHFSPSVCLSFCLPPCRSCLVSCRSSGWCYFLLTGLDSRWWQRACCCFCRLDQNPQYVFKGLELV